MCERKWVNVTRVMVSSHVSKLPLLMQWTVALIQNYVCFFFLHKSTVDVESPNKDEIIRKPALRVSCYRRIAAVMHVCRSSASQCPKLTMN